MLRSRTLLIFAGVLCALAGLATAALAQDASSVLVVINDESSLSAQVGAQYIAARRIPASNVVRIRTVVSETVNRRRYEMEIERPIVMRIAEMAAQDRILYIVLTKDVPLRIEGTSGPRGSIASADEAALSRASYRRECHTLLCANRP